MHDCVPTFSFFSPPGKGGRIKVVQPPPPPPSTMTPTSGASVDRVPISSKGKLMAFSLLGTIKKG